MSASDVTSVKEKTRRKLQETETRGFPNRKAVCCGAFDREGSKLRLSQRLSRVM